MTDEQLEPNEEIEIVDPYSGSTLRLTPWQVHQILEAEDVDAESIVPEGVVEEDNPQQELVLETPNTSENKCDGETVETR